MESPFSTFFVVHFEVGGDTRSLDHQRAFWPTAVNLVDLANQYGSKLTLQFNPQWAEFILKDQNNFSLLKEWQEEGHEAGLHHHGYDHGDWNGYTNRTEKEKDPKFRGNVADMMKLMRQFVHPYQLLSGTITDEKSDYPEDIKYDTEGIQIYHARTKPKRVILGSIRVIQVGIAFLSFEGDIEGFKYEYIKSRKDEVFGVVTHEKDFANNPEIIEKWFKFIKSSGDKITTVSEIITNYQKVYTIEHGDNPLTFLKDVVAL